MMARTIRKMQVPAYWPAFEGVHWVEKSMVSCASKKLIAIEWPELELEESMSMSPMPCMLWSMIVVVDPNAGLLFPPLLIGQCSMFQRKISYSDDDDGFVGSLSTRNKASEQI